MKNQYLLYIIAIDATNRQSIQKMKMIIDKTTTTRQHYRAISNNKKQIERKRKNKNERNEHLQLWCDCKRCKNFNTSRSRVSKKTRSWKNQQRRQCTMALQTTIDTSTVQRNGDAAFKRRNKSKRRS